jgi:hypothetical protein
MDFLNINLSEDDQKILLNILQEWKDKELEKMQLVLEQVKNEEITKINEHLTSYKEELKEEFIDKTNNIIESIKPKIRKEILLEMNETNPDIIVVNKIKDLVYPLVNESGTKYVNEITLLKNELNEMKKQQSLLEGAKKKQELLKGYSEKTRFILDKMIPEGTVEEVTEGFFNVIEGFENNFDEKDSITEQSNETLDKFKNYKKKKKVEIMDEDFNPTITSDTLTEEILKQERMKQIDEEVNQFSFRKKILKSVK